MPPSFLNMIFNHEQRLPQVMAALLNQFSTSSCEIEGGAWHRSMPGESWANVNELQPAMLSFKTSSDLSSQRHVASHSLRSGGMNHLCMTPQSAVQHICLRWHSATTFSCGGAS